MQTDHKAEIDTDEESPVVQERLTSKGKPKAQCVYCSLWFEAKNGLPVHQRTCKAINISNMSDHVLSDRVNNATDLFVKYGEGCNTCHVLYLVLGY